MIELLVFRLKTSLKSSRKMLFLLYFVTETNFSVNVFTMLKF